MKMAKPSARDIEAAEELHQVLQMLDARFGGPFQNHEAGDDLAMLLDNGDNAFDSYNLQHLQTLYNHLARLLRTAPNFYGRVIGGMVWVIMNEANQILDPESDCIDLHPRFQQMADQLIELQAKVESLRGLQPEAPPRPPDGTGLPRYGLRWNGDRQPLSVPMDDGYWTPWHLAASATAELPAETVNIPIDTLKHIRRDLDACQQVIWLAGCRPRTPGGFDPAYVTDAQARLAEIDALLAGGQQ